MLTFYILFKWVSFVGGRLKNKSNNKFESPLNVNVVVQPLLMPASLFNVDPCLGNQQHRHYSHWLHPPPPPPAAADNRRVHSGRPCIVVCGAARERIVVVVGVVSAGSEWVSSGRGSRGRRGSRWRWCQVCRDGVAARTAAAAADQPPQSAATTTTVQGGHWRQGQWQ